MEVRIVRTKSDDELYHWKYIRREYVNGQYRYYYDKTGNDNYIRSNEPKYYIGGKEKVSLLDKAKYGIQDKLGYDEKEAHNTMKNTVEMHEETLDSFKKTRDELIKDVDSDGVRTDIEQSWFDHLVDPTIKSEELDLKNAKKTYEQVLADYKKTPMYKIDKIGEKIENGKNKVKNLLKKLKRK